MQNKTQPGFYSAELGDIALRNILQLVCFSVMSGATVLRSGSTDRTRRVRIPSEIKNESKDSLGAELGIRTPGGC